MNMFYGFYGLVADFTCKQNRIFPFFSNSLIGAGFRVFGAPVPKPLSRILYCSVEEPEPNSTPSWSSRAGAEVSKKTLQLLFCHKYSCCNTRVCA